MNTAVINIKTSVEVKAKARDVASELGLSLSAVINAYLRQLIKTRTVSFSAISEEPSAYFIEMLKESRKDIEEGRTSQSFDNTEDALAWLDNSNRKYASEIQQKIRKAKR